MGVGLVPVPPHLGILAYIDGLPEETEGLVVYLELDESELDPRDVGQIALERNTYLIRINSSRMQNQGFEHNLPPSLPTINTCIINFDTDKSFTTHSDTYTRYPEL